MKGIALKQDEVRQLQFAAVVTLAAIVGVAVAILAKLFK